MKKRSIGLLIICLSIISNEIYAQDFEWAQTFGGTPGEDHGMSIALDASGNSYTTGYFSGTVDFDPGPGITSLTSIGGDDAFVLKLDELGNFVWVKRIGGTSNDAATGVDIDPSGDIVMTGFFVGTVDFNPGAGSENLSSSGNYDLFILKLDASGSFIWAKTMGGSSSDQGLSISIDGLGNSFLTGYFSSTADFDPSPGVFNMTSSGFTDVFAAKYDELGNFVWAKSVGGIGSDFGASIAVNQIGNCSVSGRFQGTVDFDTGAGTSFLTSSGPTDAFIFRLDPSGNFEWANQYGSTSSDYSNSVKVDDDGNSFLTGKFVGTVDFDPGAGTSNLVASGSGSAYITKISPIGDLIWAKSIGGTGSDEGRSIALDDFGNVYTTGSFNGTVDFDPGIGIDNKTSAGSADIFISKLDGDGNHIWAESFGGTSFDWPLAIEVDPLGNVYSSGVFYATVDFNPMAGIDNHSSNGVGDFYIQKLSQCLPNSGTDVQSQCSPYMWIDGNTYTSNEFSATHTFTNINGCDSVVTLNLTIGSPNTGTDVQNQCGPYLWIDGNTYTSNEFSATHTLTNMDGCDSVVTLNLTIGSPNSGTDVQTSCGPYMWIDGNTYTSDEFSATHTLTNMNGCDSVVTLNLTISNPTSSTDILTSCAPYLWIDGNTYASDEFSATHTLTNMAGCDSVITLNLTIITLDNSVVLDADSITANQVGANYQWLDCDDNFSQILGETNQTFVAANNGNYAVEITKNGCVDTSVCAEIIGLKIEKNQLFSLIEVYPNPSSGHITLSFSLEKNDFTINLRAVSGKLLETFEAHNQNEIDIEINESKGVYYLEVIDSKNGSYRIERVIIE